jgi:hypothetical protein
MYRHVLLLVIGLCAVAVGILKAQDDSRSVKTTGAEKIHREGTRMDQQAMTVYMENDLLSVQIGEENKSIQVLENLAAQRIYRANRDDPEDKRWTITGFLTEFEGRNYLLIEHAVRIR